jgi:hypothetical protein
LSFGSSSSGVNGYDGVVWVVFPIKREINGKFLYFFIQMSNLTGGFINRIRIRFLDSEFKQDLAFFQISAKVIKLADDIRNYCSLF